MSRPARFSAPASRFASESDDWASAASVAPAAVPAGEGAAPLRTLPAIAHPENQSPGVKAPRAAKTTALIRSPFMRNRSPSPCHRVEPGDPTAAALCPSVAAKINNLPVRFENIEDNANNRTRFFIISNFENAASGNDKTSLLVKLSNKPGSLVDFLNHFEKSEVNLTKIKSHIVGGESIFFIEFHGHKDDEKVKPILEEMKNEIKVLGSYVKETDDV